MFFVMTNLIHSLSANPGPHILSQTNTGIICVKELLNLTADLKESTFSLAILNEWW